MIQIAKLVFNPIHENTYVVWDATNECVIVDPGMADTREDAALDNFIAEKRLKPVAVVNTHGHFDHLLGAQHVQEKYGVPFLMSGKDAFLLEAYPAGSQIYGIPMRPMPTLTDLDAMGEVKFGETALRVIPTPGHTPGHVSLFEPVSKVLFTGDTLFRESIGRTDLPGGDYSWIMRSILDNILPLGDEVKVYPGHGPDTSLGHEALHNPYITEVLNQEVNYK